jgi:GMP synthase-like glutamine amidotransferase
MPRPRALAIVHQDDAGPGVFTEAFAASGFELDTWLISAEESPPRDPSTYDAIAVFGGAMHADQESLHPWLAPEKELLAGLLARGTPTLGVCLGSQLLAGAAGAPVGPARTPEIGWHEVRLTGAGSDDPVVGFLPAAFTAFGWHSYEAGLPEGAVALAHSDICLQAFRIGESAWGIQFHAEVSEPVLADWTVNYTEDPDAVRIGLDPEALAARSAREIGRWNEIGRTLCARFCDVARARVSPA